MEVHPKKPTTRGPAERFVGEAFVDAVARGHGDTPTNIAFVHLKPGARTAWHSHSVSQTLYVTNGEGRVQSRGEPIVTIRSGEVVSAPANEWHWHGATPRPSTDVPCRHRRRRQLRQARYR
jgi:quercetin dioxygenase-like cupin family protein